MKTLIKAFKYILVLIILLAIALKFILSPTPEFMRNNKVDGVEMKVQVSDDERSPIIRTFKLEDYNKKSEEEKLKIREKVAGRIEGDIPVVNLLIDKNLYYTFYKDNNLVQLEEAPRIEITAHPNHYSDKSDKRLIVDKLRENQDGYIYEINRYQDQYEKYFLEFSHIQIFFEFEGVDYISVFSIFSTNAPKGTDLFENEDIIEPIPPEH
ncbi:MAG: hypothetical protein GXY89_04410 [Tissierellia bacterium]|nr:hypothetical protein [Tissierellia bacterium]